MAVQPKHDSDNRDSDRPDSKHRLLTRANGYAGHTSQTSPTQTFGSNDAARMLGVHRSTVHLAVRHGLLKPDERTPHGHARFYGSTLEAFRARLAHGGSATGEAHALDGLRAITHVTQLAVTGASEATLSMAALEGIHLVEPTLEMRCVAVRVADSDDRYQLRLVAQKGFPPTFFSAYSHLRLDLPTVSAHILDTSATEICDDTELRPLRSATSQLCRLANGRAFIMTPLVAAKETFGVLVCMSHEPREFSEHTRIFMKAMASELAAALQISHRISRADEGFELGYRLLREALSLRAMFGLDRLSAHTMRASEKSAEADTAERLRRAQEALRAAFLKVTGALDVCLIGQPGSPEAALELAPIGPTGNQIRALTEGTLANVTVGLSRESWRAGATRQFGVAMRISLPWGATVAVGAVWPEQRIPNPEEDPKLLATFANAYLLVLYEH